MRSDAYAAAALGGDAPPGTQPVPEPDEWMRRLGALPLIAQPGERWLYSTGIDVLGVLLARATGRPLGELLAERVFAPVLAPCSVAELTTDRLTAAQRDDAGPFLGGGGWGLGLAVDERGRYGWDGGLGVGWRSDPASDTTSLLLTQVTWTGPDGPRLLHEFRAAAHG